MKNEEIMINQIEILKKLAEDLNSLSDVVEFIEADDETGIPSVVAELEDLGEANDSALAHCYFLPVAYPGLEVEQFMIMMTICDEVDEDKKIDMLLATALVNYYLPAGAFVFDPTLDTIAYKRCVTFDTTSEQEAKMEMIKFEIANSIQAVSTFVSPLLAYLYGDVDWEEFIQAIDIALTPEEN